MAEQPHDGCVFIGSVNLDRGPSCAERRSHRLAGLIGESAWTAGFGGWWQRRKGLTMHKLKPCPFCGGVPEIDTLQGYRNITTGRMENAIAVYCTSCSADISVCYADVPDIQAEQVAEMWNKREAGDLSALIARLAQALRKAAPENELPAMALDYLRREGLCGSPLRETPNFVFGRLPSCVTSLLLHNITHRPTA